MHAIFDRAIASLAFWLMRVRVIWFPNEQQITSTHSADDAGYPRPPSEQEQRTESKLDRENLKEDEYHYALYKLISTRDLFHTRDKYLKIVRANDLNIYKWIRDVDFMDDDIAKIRKILGFLLREAAIRRMSDPNITELINECARDWRPIRLGTDDPDEDQPLGQSLKPTFSKPK